MKGSNFLQQLKDLVYDWTSSSGEILEKSRKYNTRKLDADRVRFIRQFISFLLHTSFISDETKSYIYNKYSSINKIYTDFRRRSLDVNPNTIKAKIYYDKKKIVSTFGEELILDLLHNVNEDITKHHKKLSEVMLKYSDFKLLDNLAIKLPDADINYSITKKEFEQFIALIRPYTPKVIKEVKQGIKSETVGYVKYLLVSNLLSENDMDNKSKIIDLLTDDESSEDIENA